MPPIFSTRARPMTNVIQQGSWVSVVDFLNAALELWPVLSHRHSVLVAQWQKLEGLLTFVAPGAWGVIEQRAQQIVALAKTHEMTLPLAIYWINPGLIQAHAGLTALLGADDHWQHIDWLDAHGRCVYASDRLAALRRVRELR